MPKKIENNLVVGLDIGTSKVVAIVADVMADGTIDILGIGSHPSRGLKKGVVVNIDATVQSVQRAIEEAELMAGCQIQSVYTGIAGSHIKSLNSHGIVAIKDSEVTQLDINRVIEAAKAVPIPANQKILHVLPQSFTLDHQTGIHEPIGMSGVRLEADVHIITGSVSAAQNIVNCVRRCRLDVDDIILEQLASSYAVLGEDEKNLGVCMIDIGGGTTDIAVYVDGALFHTAVIPVAGDQVTNDIAVALRTPTQSAEAIKIQYGCALRSAANVEDTIEVPHVGDRGLRTIRQIDLAEVVEPRYDELFSLIRAELTRVGLADKLGSGVVLTGGSSKMKGVLDLAERVFQMPVRLGYPNQVSGLTDVVKNPIFSTGIGLLLYGAKSPESQFSVRQQKGVKGVFGRIKHWFAGNF